jgi:chromosome segregation ATPase
MAQIHSCEAQIKQIKQHITELVQRISNQEDTRSVFKNEAQDYEEQIFDYDRKHRGIESVADYMRYARRSSAVMGEHKSRRNSNEARLMNITDIMEREISENKDHLQIAERDLFNLQHQLSSLQAAYNDALRRENEEAVAAAK